VPTATTLLTILDPALRAALDKARKNIRLASPYISAGTTLWLEVLAKRRQATWHLLTSLDPVAAAYGSLHLEGLRELLTAGVQIRHLDDLHAKLFLTESHGFVGSANLTDAGLGSNPPGNHELTVALTADQRTKAGAVFDRWYGSAQPVDLAMIRNCERQAAKLPIRLKRPPTVAPGKAALIDRTDELLEEATGVDVWIKAIDIDDGGWGPGAWISNSRRARFSVGDLVVIYSKYHQACTSLLRVDKLAVEDPQALRDVGYPEENAIRWRWVSEVSCLLEFPEDRYVPITETGKSGQSLQGGYCRMPVGGLAATLRYVL
jgi:hypothetical protein